MEKKVSVRKRSMEQANPAGFLKIALLIPRNIADSLDRQAGKMIVSRNTIIRQALRHHAEMHDAEFSD